VAVGADFLRIISWNFLFQGVVFTCSGIFQGLGNTRPALLSSAMRLVMFVPVVVWFSSLDDFTLAQVWYVSVVTMIFQSSISWWLLQRELNRRLKAPPAPPTQELPAEGTV
jgi:Na+-driven multidrug efflux pump